MKPHVKNYFHDLLEWVLLILAWLTAVATIVLITGCAHFASRTMEQVPTQVGTNTVMGYRSTHMYVTTFFDSQTALAKAANSPSVTATNQYSAGTRLGGLNQEASGTNAVNLLESAVGAAVSAAIKAGK